MNTARETMTEAADALAAARARSAAALAMIPAPGTCTEAEEEAANVAYGYAAAEAREAHRAHAAAVDAYHAAREAAPAVAFRDDRTLTRRDVAEAVAAGDVAEEAARALESGAETTILVSAVRFEGRAECVRFAFFPIAGRGAANAGGASHWTDADGIDDLVDRWVDFEERWGN